MHDGDVQGMWGSADLPVVTAPLSPRIVSWGRALFAFTLSRAPPMPEVVRARGNSAHTHMAQGATHA